MKKILAALVISVGLVAPTTAVVPAAGADTPGCVSVREFFKQLRGGDSKGRVKRLFDTKGREVDRWRSGRNGRLLDTIQQYRACGINRGDELLVGFDDYTYGSSKRGGTLRAYAALWSHYCRDYEDFYDYEGEWVYDPETGEEVYDPYYYEYYSYSYCYDRHFEGEFYDESMERRSGKGAARIDREPVIALNVGRLREPV